MKKAIVSFLMILCFSLCFVGCNNSLSNEYWKDTSANLTEYFETQIFSDTLNPTFNDNLQEIMEADYGTEYAELASVYGSLFKQTIFCSQKYANVFMAVPTTENNKLQGAFKTININLENFKTEIDKFAISKANYLSHINFTDQNTAQSEIEKARLNKFKLDYLSLLQKAYELSNSIFNAYTIGYYNFLDLSQVEPNSLTAIQIDINLKIALNGSNLQIASSEINLLRVQIEKQTESGINKFWDSCKIFFQDAVVKVYDNDYSGADSTIVYNKLSAWQGVYAEFIEDVNKFDKIVNEIKLDVLAHYDNDAFAYSQATKQPADQSKATFFLNYYKNVELLNKYALNLINFD